MKQLLIVLISCSLGGCAAGYGERESGAIDDSEHRRDCIFRSSIRGYTVLDDSNLVVDGSGRRKYHVTLKRRARSLTSSRSLRFESPTGRICAGFSEVLVNGFLDSDKVRIERIVELSADEHEDLLIRYGKKTPETEQMPAPQDVEGADIEELDPAAKSN